MVEDTVTQIDGMVTVAEAARRLDVSQSMVRQLIGRGDLSATRLDGRHLVHEDAIERRRGMGTRSGRPLTTERAWGLLSLADGGATPWLTPQVRWRLRRLLAERSWTELHPKLGQRGQLRELRAHPSQLSALRAEPSLMLTGASAASDLRLGLAGVVTIDAYADEDAFGDLRRRYHLQPSRDPNVSLRVHPVFAAAWPRERYAPRAAIALDLLGDRDPRAREVGLDLMRSLAP